LLSGGKKDKSAEMLIQKSEIAAFLTHNLISSITLKVNLKLIFLKKSIYL